MAKPIKVEILGDASGFNKALDGVGGGLGNLGKMVGTAGLALGAFAVGGVAAAAKGLFDLGSRFDDVSDTIRVTTGATGEALKGLEDSFRNVAKNVASPIEDVSTAIAGLNQRLEITGKPLEDLTTQFLNLSRITDSDLATNIDKFTRVFGDWSIATGDQAKVMDQLYRAAQKSGIPIDELASSIVELGGPLRSMGFDLQESASLLALWNKTGVNTETIFGGLRQAIGKFAKEGLDPAKEIRKTIEEIERLAKVDPGKAVAEAVGIFGKKAAADIVDSIVGQKFALEDFLEVVVNGGDTINQAAEDTGDWAEQWQILKNKAFLGLEPIARAVFGGIGSAIDFVAPKLTNFITGGIEAFRGAWERADGSVTQSGFNGVLERLAGIIQQQLWPWLQDLGHSLQIMALVAWPIFEDAIRGAYVIFEKLINFARDHETVMLGLKVTILGIAVAAGIAALAIGAMAAVFGGLVGAAVIALAAVVGSITKFFQWIQDNRQKWIDNIKAPFVEGLGWVERKWNDLKQTFSNPFGGAFGALPGRAMGGSVGVSGMYRINERSAPGGETVFLPSGSRVQPNYSGGGGGGGDTFNIYAPNAGPAEVAREIAWRRRIGDGR